MSPSRAPRKSRKVGKIVPSLLHKPDYVLLITVFFLVLFGLIMVFDASVVFANEQFDDKFHFLKAQTVWIILGSIALFVAMSFDYHKIKNFVVPMIVGTVGLLILVLFMSAINGSRRWIDLGFGTLQPSELAKLTFTIYLASWLSKAREKRTAKTIADQFSEHIMKELLPFLVVLGVLCILVLLEPDLGSTLLIGATALVMYFISGSDAIHAIGSFMIILVMGLLGVLAAILSPYRLERVKTFIPLLLRGEVEDPLGAGYQIRQILIAVGSGGWKGLGFGESRQKFQYLVETTAVTDSIFAVIAEELGFIGSVILLTAFALFIYRGYQIAKNAPDRFGMLLAAGITFWLGIQALLNIAANVAIIPLTGIPLPFISYGGSSLVITMAAVGILLNVSRQTADK